MLTASKKLDYGILLMASLPEQGDHNFRSLHDIADEKQLSAGYLSKLMSPLRRAGLVSSREGLHGGYQLARPSASITLEDIYTALEGPLSLTTCLSKEKQCICEQQCPTKSVWSELQGIMSDYLAHKTLSEFRSSLLVIS